MTLTQLSTKFRRWVIITAIFAVIYYLLILLLIPSTKSFIAGLFPKKDPASPIYGMLPPLQFVEKKTRNTSAPSFKLDTANGRLPDEIPLKMTVYKIDPPIPSFEKGKDAINTANTLGYFEEDLVSSLKDKIYKWKKLESNGELNINTDTREIVMKTPLEGKTAVFPRGNINNVQAVNFAKEILTNIGRFYDPLYQNGKQEVVLGHYVGNKIEKADNQFDAQIARVDFFRSIDNKPIVGPDPKKGLVYLLLKNPSVDKIKRNFYTYPEMETHIWSVQQQSNATYPVIPVTTAWNFVKENKGVAVSIVPDNSSTIEEYNPVVVEEVFINNIYLGYYDNSTYQPFLQPVYIFEGKYTTSGTQGGKIVYYYPAVDPQWIKTE